MVSLNHTSQKSFMRPFYFQIFHNTMKKLSHLANSSSCGLEEVFRNSEERDSGIGDTGRAFM